MKQLGQKIGFTIAGLLLAIAGFGQQLFPVQVNGVMIPPRALNINVYGTDRSQDLTYFATLVDRDEPFLDVRLRLTIENKGKIIYQTDPNFLGPIINLRQFQAYTIRGSDLRPYLTPSALVGPTNQGQGSVEVPEGFNRICLEVMGTVRKVPLSNRFCVSGNFKLNQPPFLVKPVCGDRSELPMTQNLLFNWRPMHRGSSNSPNPVEYEFTLVELPPGVTNANDAFNSSMRVYNTTTTNPTLFYGAGQPRLLPDKIYAWRVKAIPSNHRTSLLFENSGLSEVCTFSYYTEDIGGGGTFPGSGGTTTGGGGVEDKDKAPPTGCEVYKTDYGPVSSNSPNSVPIIEEDVVKVGYFEMEVRSVAPSGGGYNGSGAITVPLFNCKVNVEFSNLKVNSALRAFAADKIVATVDPIYKKQKTQLSSQMNQAVNNRYVKNLDEFFNNGGGVDRLTSGFNSADPVAVNLPLAVDQQEQPLMAVVAMEFTPRNAYMTAVAWQKQTSDEYLRFGAADISISPFGTKNKSELKLLEAGEGGLIEVSPAFFISFAASKARGMSINCQGTQKIAQPAGVKILETILKKSDSNSPLYLDLERDKDEMLNYYGKVDEIPAFNVTSYPDLEFTAKQGYLDFNTDELVKFTSSHREYTEPEEEKWRGLILDQVRMALPREYDVTGAGRTKTLSGGQIIMDENDIYIGRVSKFNDIDLEEGLVGTWPFSVDSLYADLGPEQYLKIHNYGRIKTPFFVDTFQYHGTFIKNDSGKVIWDARPIPEELNMPMWKGQFKVDTASKMITRRIQIKDRPSEFAPKGYFTGSILWNWREQDFMDGLNGNKGLIRKTLTETLGVDSLHFVCMNLELENLTLDTKSPPNYFYYMDEWEQEDLNVKVGGKEFPVEVVNLIHRKKTNALPNRIGLKIGFRSETTMVEYTIWSQEVNGEYLFEGIDVYSYYSEPGSN